MTLPDISTRHLRYFLAAAEAGQFSLAAHTVHVSQTAITNAVSTLEGLLGVRLFDRHPHGVSLTAEGHHFVQHARHVLNVIDDAMRTPVFRTYDISGEIRISATYTVMGYFLAPYLARFQRTHPKVTVRLSELRRPELEKAVQADQVDVAIAVVPPTPIGEGLKMETIARSRRQLWTAENHPLCSADEVSLAEIARYPLIRLVVDEGGASSKRYWSQRKLSPNILLETESMEALRTFVGLGLGVTILADLVFRPWTLEGRRIETRPITDVVPPMEIGVIQKPGRRRVPAAEAFERFLKLACAAGIA
jgi:DNA-binding transcriptional LysR family regulator